ncbi:Thimet oligopeptidase [Burkholderiales bacterium]|nr:Thimet oligopeptidase [Burkholderiales bacterium]
MTSAEESAEETMKGASTVAALAIATASPLAALGAAPGAALPPGFPVLGAHQIAVRCDEELEQRRKMLANMERRLGPGRILEEFNALAIRTGGFDDPLSVLQNAAPDEETRSAAQTCLEKLVPFATELYQSPKLYARVEALKPTQAQDQSYRRLLMENFEDTGATLPPDKRGQVKAIEDELSTLSLQFQKNMNDVATTVALTPAQVEGLSEDWRNARKRDADGNYLVSLDYPSYGPFMESALDADARRRVWTAFQNRAGTPNLELLDRALVLRSELAQVYGFPDFATFSLRRKMAGSPQAVADFLLSVKSAVDEVEAGELEELRQEKASLAGVAAADVRLERWDISFLQQRVKHNRFHVDQEALRTYFPTDASVGFVMRVAEKLYAIRFVRRDVALWHPDVRYYEVMEQGPKGEPGALIGGIYLDLFPREGKYSHAAAFGVRNGSVLTGQHPIKALLCNFNSRGLNQSELETLTHEFGHALHGVLSKTRYADQSGTAVRLDFVEAPSQMFEEWARREQSLRVFAEVCPQCPVLGAQQLEQLAAARRFGMGVQYARQWLYASYDLALHTGAPKSALATWAQMEGASRLGHVAGTMFPASLGHIMGGYEAGLYSYMWSQVLALDMLSVFHGNLLDAAVGRRYRHIILESGGSRPPQELVEEFLGRKPSSDAFYAEITGKR